MTYSVSRKADRHAMAAQLADLIADCGFTSDIIEESDDGFHDRRVAVCILKLPYNLRLTIELEPCRGLGAELGHAEVLSWHGVQGKRLNPDAFAFDAVNPFHGHKATDIIHTFDQLKHVLAKRLASVADGSAFIEGY